jgi:radical SAM superfamily enzyme YgiQ (UPF0313 family)
MKIAFFVPEYFNSWIPLNVLSLISFAHHNYSPSLSFKVYMEQFEDKTDIVYGCLDADIVGMTCTTPTYYKCLSLAKFLKSQKPTIKIVLGGWHATVAQPTDRCFDHIVVGEGEDAFLSILYGNKSRVIVGARRPFSQLYWPDRRYVPQDKILDVCEEKFGERVFNLQTVRGCKFSCAMCAECHMSRNDIRIRDPEDALDEIELHNDVYKIDRFITVDPTWAISEKAVEAFCSAKIRRNNKIKWNCMVHAGLATEKMLEDMYLANCDVIMIGCESGNDKIRQSIGKGVTTEKLKKVFKWGKEIGLNRRAFFIVGFPEETKETIEETKQLVDELQPDVVGFTLLAAYPGTRYWRKEFETVDWSNVDEYSNDFWYTKNFSNNELKIIQNQLVKEFKDKVCWHNKEILRLNDGDNNGKKTYF